MSNLPRSAEEILPVELWALILQKVDDLSLFPASSVCTLWNYLLAGKFPVKIVINSKLNDVKGDNAALNLLEKYGSNIIQLCLNIQAASAGEMADKLISYMERVPNLELLEVNGVVPMLPVLRVLGECFKMRHEMIWRTVPVINLPALRSLSVRPSYVLDQNGERVYKPGRDLGSYFALLFSSNFQQLRKLAMTGIVNDFVFSRDTLVNLSELDMNGSALTNLYFFPSTIHKLTVRWTAQCEIEPLGQVQKVSNFVANCRYFSELHMHFPEVKTGIFPAIAYISLKLKELVTLTVTNGILCPDLGTLKMLTKLKRINLIFDVLPQQELREIVGTEESSIDIFKELPTLLAFTYQLPGQKLKIRIRGINPPQPGMAIAPPAP